MIRINSTAASGPSWLEIVPGEGRSPPVKLLVEPNRKALRRRALEAAQQLHPDINLSDEATTNGDLITLTEEIERQIALLAIKDWSGVTADGKTPWPFSTEHLALAVADEDSGFMEAFVAAYIAPQRDRDMEKNGLTALPRGTGTAATQAKATAKSRAARKPADDASSAPIAASGQSRKRGRQSGTS